MALAITVFIQDGILMASDALDVSYVRVGEAGPFQPFVSHTSTHTLLCPNGAGLSFAGTTTYKNAPLIVSVKEFIRERVKPDTRVDDIPWMLFDHYYSSGEVPRVSFLLAGYQDGEQKVSKLRLETKACEVMNTKSKGIAWTGEASFLTRLLMPLHIGEGEESKLLPKPEMPWGLYTVDEAAKILRFLIDGAGEYASFKAGLAQAGKLADLLYLTPEGSRFLVKDGKEQQ